LKLIRKKEKRKRKACKELRLKGKQITSLIEELIKGIRISHFLVGTQITEQSSIGI